MMKMKKKLEKKTRLWEHIPEFLWNLWLTTFIGKRNNKTLRFGGTNADTFENFGNFFIPQKLWNVNDKLDIKLTDLIKFAPQAVPCRLIFFSMNGYWLLLFGVSSKINKKIMNFWISQKKFLRKNGCTNFFYFYKIISRIKKKLIFYMIPLKKFFLKHSLVFVHETGLVGT